MLRDGRDITSRARPEALEADVCIVGAGPAGTTLAKELDGSGMRVLLLESGGESSTGRLARRLTRGEAGDRLYYRLSRSRFRGLGGSSREWAHPRGVRCHRLMPLDFEARPGIPDSGWPFDARHLDPFYQRVRRQFGLPDADESGSSWATAERPALPLPEDLVETTMFQFAPGARAENLLPALRRSDNVTVVVNATVLELVPDADGSAVDRLTVAAAPGRTFQVRARRVVLAGGGIENARLLLASNRAAFHGLGNAHDLVGRYFMEHPHARTGVVRLSPTAKAALGLYEIHDTPAARVQGQLRLTEPVVRDNHLLNSAWWLFPREEALVTNTARVVHELRMLQVYGRGTAHTTARAKTVAQDPVGAARAVRRGWRGAAKHAPTHLLLAVTAEQAPDRESRVTLGTRTDAFGRPLPRLRWRLNELDRQSIRRTQNLLDEAFQRTGLGFVEGRLGEERPPVQLGAGFHHMGTTRMHDDPRHGVVNRYGRVHEVDNLYVTGSSVFPTSGFANPTLTLVALAIRLADHLRAESAADAPPYEEQRCAS